MLTKISECVESACRVIMVNQVSAIDVAKYILVKAGEMSAPKLQKLVYYSQAWSLAWDKQPLFDDDIFAWDSGPIVASLFAIHQGQLRVNKNTFADGNIDALTENQKDSIDKVLEALQGKSGQWLSDLVQSEQPWKEARIGIPPIQRSENIISLLAMRKYYSSLS